MAIFQYNLFVVPEEELNSYFQDSVLISSEDFNEILWWKYRLIDSKFISSLETILPKNISWSTDIILFGNENSNCIELLLDENNLIEVSIRIDLRSKYKSLLGAICTFFENLNCVFINKDYKILPPKFKIIQKNIEDDNSFENFIAKIKS